ncbi:MAG: DUF4097 family beta strand repeat-containing protein [Bacillota bacterium]
MNTVVTRKVGRITVAIGLVGLGAALLMDNLLATGPTYTSLILRFWPALLIGFGLEYLLFSFLDQGEDGQQLRLRFDVGGALLLALVVGLTAGFSSLSHIIPNPRDYVFVGGSTSNDQTSFAPAEGAKEVVVDVDFGRVILYSQKLQEVRAEASYTMHGTLRLRDQAQAVDDFTLSVEEGETVRVTGRAPQGINLGGLSATYRVYVPEGMAVRVQTGAGSIQVQDYTGELKLTSKFGSITVTASTGRLDAETGSGSIHVTAHDGPVVARTMAGRININRVTGALQLDSGTGSISVDQFAGGKLVAETRMGSIQVSTQADLEGDVLLRTSTGSINLMVPGSSSMKVTAQTKTGSITGPDFLAVSQSGASRTAVGTTGDGRHVVTLEAGMGSIQLSTR